MEKRDGVEEQNDEEGVVLTGFIFFHFCPQGRKSKPFKQQDVVDDAEKTEAESLPTEICGVLT